MKNRFVRAFRATDIFLLATASRRARGGIGVQCRIIDMWEPQEWHSAAGSVDIAPAAGSIQSRASEAEPRKPAAIFWFILIIILNFFASGKAMVSNIR